MDQQQLRRLLTGFAGRRILVIGDCMLDEYVWGRVSRISPEAPVMVVEQVRTTYAAGGASNVAVNLVAMGARASIVAVVGDDANGERLRVELERQGVAHHGLVNGASRPTTVKTRIIAHSQQVLRLDKEERAPVAPEEARALIASVEEQIGGADALLLSDYGKGVLTPEVVESVLSVARERGRPTFANPKPPAFRHYQGISLVSLNQSEAEAVTGLSLAALETADEVGERLMDALRAEAALVTLGARGLLLFQNSSGARHWPVVPFEVYDAAGCGDSVISAAALGRVAGGDWPEVAALGNLAGNAKVRKLGVVPVTREEIAEVWEMSEHGRATPAFPE